MTLRAQAILAKLGPTEVFDSYWALAAERQEIFFRRIEGTSWPWTSDTVLSSFRFTNAYRAADRTSQFLIRKVIYSGDQDPSDIIFRILLFKIFNRIETWQELCKQEELLSPRTFSPPKAIGILDRLQGSGCRIYSGAYIMPSGPAFMREARKHHMHLRLVHRIAADGILEKLSNTISFESLFRTLREIPSFGDFLAYQLAIDINYSTVTDFTENDFVVPGPGARSGILKCFKHATTTPFSQIIAAVCEMQAIEFARRGLKFRSLWGRELTLVDCQNLFCEVDKYARVRHPDITGAGGRSRMKRRYDQSTSELPRYWFPPKWAINHRIGNSLSVDGVREWSS